MHLTQVCWGKGAGGEGGAATPCHVLSWNTKPVTLSAGACVVHPVFVHTLGPALQEYLSPEPGGQCCSLLHGENSVMWCLLSPPDLCFEGCSFMVQSMWSSVSWYYSCERNKLGDKICLSGPFLLTDIFPVVLVFKTKHTKHLWQT